MKKFLSIIALTAALFAFTNNNAQAQIVRSATVSKATLSNADTAYATLSVSNMVSAEALVTKVSGTVAGTVYLQGTVDGTNYVNIDSLTLANTATQLKVFSTAPLIYAKYRLQFITSGGSVTPKAYTLARTQ